MIGPILCNECSTGSLSFQRIRNIFLCSSGLHPNHSPSQEFRSAHHLIRNRIEGNRFSYPPNTFPTPFEFLTKCLCILSMFHDFLNIYWQIFVWMLISYDSWNSYQPVKTLRFLTSVSTLCHLIQKYFRGKSNSFERSTNHQLSSLHWKWPFEVLKPGFFVFWGICYSKWRRSWPKVHQVLNTNLQFDPKQRHLYFLDLRVCILWR